MKKWHSYVLLLLALVAALSVIHFSVKFNKEIGLQKLFRTTQLKTLEERLNLFITWGFYLGIYVLTLVILIIFYRILSGKSPVDGADPPIIKCLNQLLSNTLEQGLIFGSFYAYWLHFVARVSRIEEALLFPFLFLLARVIFAVLYLLSVAVKVPPLRSTGFMINIITIGILLLENITPIPVLTRYFGAA